MTMTTTAKGKGKGKKKQGAREMKIETTHEKGAGSRYILRGMYYVVRLG